MSWLQLSLSVEQQQAAAMEELLLAGGAVSVTLQDNQDQPILEPGVGETPLWQQVKLTALYDISDSRALDRVLVPRPGCVQVFFGFEAARDHRKMVRAIRVLAGPLEATFERRSGRSVVAVFEVGMGGAFERFDLIAVELEGLFEEPAALVRMSQSSCGATPGDGDREARVIVQGLRAREFESGD